MNDLALANWLRTYSQQELPLSVLDKMDEAADAIDRLTARVERLRTYIETIGPIYDTTVFDRIATHDPQAH